MIKHERVQHPIGQGFFHSASLDFNDLVIRYIYDCGSDNLGELWTSIRSLSDEVSVSDILFISHLDADHVNGLDLLLGRLTCQVVVLPYQSSYERVLLAISAAEKGKASGNYLQFLGDPAGWLAGRGARTIIFVRGNDNEEPVCAFPDIPPPKDGRDDAPRHWHLVAGDQTVEVTQGPVVAPDVRSIDHRDPLVIELDGNAANWGFLTFVHPERSRIDLFSSRVDAAFPGVFSDTNPSGGGTILTQPIREVLVDSVQRSKLANCYAAIASDRNYTSMSLYSGPFLRLPRGAHEVISKGAREKDSYCSEVGWLGTGDAALNVERRRRHFLKHYERLLPLTRTFALPHHGSDENFDKGFLPPNAKRFVVSFGSKNKYGHPGKAAEGAIIELKRQLVKTNENVGTKLTEAFEISALR